MSSPSPQGPEATLEVLESLAGYEAGRQGRPHRPLETSLRPKWTAGDWLEYQQGEDPGCHPGGYDAATPRMLGGGEGTDLRVRGQKLNKSHQYHTVLIKDTGRDTGAAWFPALPRVDHTTKEANPLTILE